MSKPTTVALVTLGCARNDVDSEELAGRLAADGWTLVDDPSSADIAVVNTCGFIESAKKRLGRCAIGSPFIESRWHCTSGGRRWMYGGAIRKGAR